MKPVLIGAACASLFVVACGGGGSSSSPAATASVTRGTITSFGSVVVQGVHYDTSRAGFSVDGASGKRQDDLSVGQRVTIRGTVDDNGNHHATEVEYEAELHGLVQSVDAANSRFVALGQTIVVDAGTIYSGLADLSALVAGDPVEVSGSRQADGSLLATYVQREDASAEAELRGPVANVDTVARSFTIGTLTIDYSGATLLPTGFVPADGASVKVKGSINGAGVLVATRVKQDRGFGGDDRSDDRGARGELEGTISNYSSATSSFTIDTTTVSYSASTTFQDGTAAALADGVAVEVKGTIQADGSLAASRIEFKNGDGSSGDDHGGGAGHAGREGTIQAAITAIDATARTFTVLGATVSVADSTVYRDQRDGVRTFGFADLVVGDYIEVGFVRSGSTLIATKLERDRSDSRSEVKGALDSLDPASETLVISGVTVSASGARYQINDGTVSTDAFYSAATVGSKVKAKGSATAGGLTATEVELDRD